MLNSSNKVIDLLEFKPLLLNQNRLMGLDLGKKRIGVSISTSSMDGALALRTIEEEKFSSILHFLGDIIKEYNVKGIIFGLPLNMDGTEGKSVQSVRDKAEKIGAELDVKYSFWDERLSTVAVDRFYAKPYKSRAKKKTIKKDIDNLASAFILEGALNYIINN